MRISRFGTCVPYLNYNIESVNPDGDVGNVDEYLKKRGHILNRLLGIIGLTSYRNTLVDTDISFDPELDESEFLDEEGILGNSSNSGECQSTS